MRSSSVTTEQYKCAKPLILQFQNISTLNYDLLLYWVINKSDIAPVGRNTDDGFRHTNWENVKTKNVYFLHGGLHINDDDIDINKHAFIKDADIRIVDQVRDNLN